MRRAQVGQQMMLNDVCWLLGPPVRVYEAVVRLASLSRDRKSARTTKPWFTVRRPGRIFPGQDIVEHGNGPLIYWDDCDLYCLEAKEKAV